MDIIGRLGGDDDLRGEEAGRRTEVWTWRTEGVWTLKVNSAVMT